MSATVDGIYLAPRHGENQQAVRNATLTEGIGLKGDRYANARGGIVTLIEAEEVERFNQLTGLAISGADTGRNIVTRGVRLNELVGRSFRLGAATLEAFELCEPCATLGKRLSTQEIASADIVAAFTHKAGVRAFVRGSGEITAGSPIIVS